MPESYPGRAAAPARTRRHASRTDLFFDGTCEAALAEYARIFGGEIVMLSRYADAPSSTRFPPDLRDRVLHATFEGPGFTLMASDTSEHGRGEMARASISIALPDADQGRRLFDELAAGGSISMPYEKQFWGATFGSVTDRFGISWMINAS